MDRRFQVFVSADFSGEQGARAETARALLEQGCLPVGMGLYPIDAPGAWRLTERLIEEADFYVLVLAGRYGPVLPETGLGRLEMEYEQALAAGTPVLACLHAEPMELAPERRDPEPGLAARRAAFDAKARERAHRDWVTPADLGAALARALGQSIRRAGETGWLPADRPRPEDALEIERLRRRTSELEHLLERFTQDYERFGEFFLSLTGEVALTPSIAGRSLNPRRVEREELALKILDQIGADSDPMAIGTEILRHYFRGKENAGRMRISAESYAEIKALIHAMKQVGLVSYRLRSGNGRGGGRGLDPLVSLTADAKTWLEMMAGEK